MTERQKNEDVLAAGSAHYKLNKIQPIQIIFKLGLGPAFCIGNVIKYLVRYLYYVDNKDKRTEDLIKAKHYIEFLITNDSSPL